MKSNAVLQKPVNINYRLTQGLDARDHLDAEIRQGLAADQPAIDVASSDQARFITEFADGLCEQFAAIGGN